MPDVTPTVVVVMGVTGSGKTTIGRNLAAALGWTFVDGDDHHPAANVAKMKRGEPLSDADRAPWLDSLRERIHAAIERGERTVLACSALKEAYRERLRVGDAVTFVYLKGSYEVIAERIRKRRGHFAGTNLLASQFADLEEPTDAIVVDVSNPPEKIVEEIRARLET
jgi:carbohydrate kinase (thermoresistant glucokinase family)